MIQGPKHNPRHYGATDEDFHLVISAETNTAKMFRFSDGALLWEKPALPQGQHARWWEYRGDTPPGTYKIGQVWYQYKDAPNPKFDKPYGHICYDLVDYEGNEDGNGRSGIAIHGGGSSLGGALYWAKKQRLVPTWGCVRMHNEDLYCIDECYKQGDVWVSVYQDDK